MSTDVHLHRDLLLNSVATSIDTLGPGPACCIWVQGCGIGCRECTSPHTWDRAAGVLADVLDVVRWLRSTRFRYLTISGGEPFDQAPVLTELLDLLIDGPYSAERHAPLLWRGSSNQRLHRLSDRIVLPPDESAGVSVDIRPSGQHSYVGVPPVRGFRELIAGGLRSAIGPIDGPVDKTSFPFPIREVP